MEEKKEGGFKIIEEGKAKILYQPSPEEESTGAAPVFYNPVQEFNRDTSVLVLNTFARMNGFKEGGMKVLEALAATGLRSIRFLKEVPAISTIIINDLDPQAIETAKKNLAYNNIDMSKVQIENKDANALMQQLSLDQVNCDVIDIDPYGTAIDFLDAAIRNVKNGGLLCATCTDAAVLCEASQKNTCFARYASCSPRKHGMREAGVRALLYCISQFAAKYKMIIIPMLSFFSDFYFRVFVKVKHSAKEAPSIIKTTSLVVSCVNCQYYHLQHMNVVVEPCIQKCPICSSGLKITGPIWSDPIHDQDFIDNLVKDLPSFGLKTEPKIKGLFAGIKEEFETKVPPLGYYTHLMISELKSNAASLKVLLAGLNSLGYEAMQSAMEHKSIKTTAPAQVFYDLLKHLKKTKFADQPYIPPHMSPDSFQYKILSTEIKLPKEPNYVSVKGKTERLPRYFPNPEPNWGPKARAHGTKRPHAEAENENEEEKVEEIARETKAKNSEKETPVEKGKMAKIDEPTPPVAKKVDPEEKK